MPLHQRLLMILTLVALSISVAGCSVGRVSEADEIRIGQQVQEEVEARYPTRSDAMVNRIGQQMAAVSERPGLPYRFRVIESDEINAVALPGGPIYVFDGLLRATGNDEQMIAGVLAHEVGHIARRHSAQQIERQQWYGVGVEVLTGVGAPRDIASIAANLQLLSYSRRQEHEADEAAVTYTRATGYDPRGLVRFFDLLLERERGGGTVSWLRTHPATEARRERVLSLIGEAEAEDDGEAGSGADGESR